MANEIRSIAAEFNDLDLGCNVFRLEEDLECSLNPSEHAHSYQWKLR